MLKGISAVVAGILLGLPAVPYAVAIGLHPTAAIAWASVGMIVGMTGVTFLCERLLLRSRTKAEAKGAESKFDTLAQKARPMVDRVGVPGLGLIGIFVFGTSSSAVIGTVLGISRRKLLPWLAVGVVVWATIIDYVIEFVVGLFR